MRRLIAMLIAVVALSLPISFLSANVASAAPTNGLIGTITLKTSSRDKTLLTCSKMKANKCVGTKRVIKRGQTVSAQGFWVGPNSNATVYNPVLFTGLTYDRNRWVTVMPLRNKVESYRVYY